MQNTIGRQVPASAFHRGGQYHIGLFGVGERRVQTPAAPCAPLGTTPPPPKPRPAPYHPRIVDEMSFAQRRAKIRAMIWVPPAREPSAAEEARIAAQERQERLEEEAAARAATTPTMRAAARATDERERFTVAQHDHDASYQAFMRRWFPHVQAMMREGA